MDDAMIACAEAPNPETAWAALETAYAAYWRLVCDPLGLARWLLREAWQAAAAEQGPVA